MPERLLYSISSRGKMSFSNFDAAFSAIYSQVYKTFPEDVNFTYAKYQTLRFLDALGHCDFDFGRRYIYSCKPAFVLVPSFGLQKVLLTGARDRDLLINIKKLTIENKRSVIFYSFPQKVGRLLLPNAIYLETADQEFLNKALSKIGIHLRIDEPAAWSLLNFSADISEIGNNLSFLVLEQPNWPKRMFSVIDLVFHKYFTHEADIKFVEYTNPIDQHRIHWFWRGNKAAEIDRDWGRFLSLYEQNVNVILYDVKRFLLAVPASIPLPRLIARGLTLCTGLAASQAMLEGRPIETVPNDCKFDIYQTVTPSIAEVVSRKLGQTLIKYNLEIDEDGVIT